MYPLLITTVHVSLVIFPLTGATTCLYRLSIIYSISFDKAQKPKHLIVKTSWTNTLKIQFQRHPFWNSACCWAPLGTIGRAGRWWFSHVCVQPHDNTQSMITFATFTLVCVQPHDNTQSMITLTCFQTQDNKTITTTRQHIMYHHTNICHILHIFHIYLFLP